MTDTVTVRLATERDLPDILHIHKAAFGDEEIDALVSDLLQDPSARPTPAAPSVMISAATASKMPTRLLPVMTLTPPSERRARK